MGMHLIFFWKQHPLLFYNIHIYCAVIYPIKTSVFESCLDSEILLTNKTASYRHAYTMLSRWNNTANCRWTPDSISFGILSVKPHTYLWLISSYNSTSYSDINRKINKKEHKYVTHITLSNVVHKSNKITTKSSIKKKKKKTFGDAGHRSPYLSHAKRALYHLSYAPILFLIGATHFK